MDYTASKRIGKTWYAPSKLIKPGLTYQRAQDANNYYHALAMLKIHRAIRALFYAGYKNPSQRMIARFARACTKTVRKALLISYNDAVCQVREALYVLSSRCSKDLERSTTLIKKSFEQASSGAAKPVKTSDNPRIAAMQRRCFERASEKEPPPREMKTITKTKIVKDGLSLVFRPHEIQAWKSPSGKEEIKAVFAQIFKKMHWLNRPKGPPITHMANAGAYKIWRPSLQSH